MSIFQIAALFAFLVAVSAWLNALFLKIPGNLGFAAAGGLISFVFSLLEFIPVFKDAGMIF